MRLYGANAVQDVLEVNPDAIARVLIVEGARLEPDLERMMHEAGLSAETVPATEMKQRAGRRGAVRIGADLRRPPELDCESLGALAHEGKLVVALDGITDPHNLGAIMRSAAAFGALAVMTTERRAAPLNDAAVRASAGAVAHIPLVRVVNLARALRSLQKAGYWIAGTLPTTGQPPWEVDLTGPLVVVIGAEGPGIRPGVQSVCDLAVRLDLPGQIKALNASVFTGIMLAESAKQRLRTAPKT